MAKPTLTCPHCGFQGIEPTDPGHAAEHGVELHTPSDGVIRWHWQKAEPCAGFYLLDTIKVYRRIQGIAVKTVEGQAVPFVQVHGLYQTGEGYDDGLPFAEQEIECRKCLGTFPVPEGFEENYL